MNVIYSNQIKQILTQFETGEINKKQAVLKLIDMPDNPDFKGIWEILIVHIVLIEISRGIPNTDTLIRHWLKEIKTWQKRIMRFMMKPKPSFRNAVKKNFYQACDQLFKDDYANLLFSMETHLEETIDPDEYPIADQIEKLNLEMKETEWYLSYGESIK